MVLPTNQWDLKNVLWGTAPSDNAHADIYTMKAEFHAKLSLLRSG